MVVSTNADVAAKVRGAAAEQRMTQAELATALSLSPMAISRRMSGATPFAPQELIKAAQVLHTSVSALFGETDR